MNLSKVGHILILHAVAILAIIYKNNVYTLILLVGTSSYIVGYFLSFALKEFRNIFVLKNIKNKYSTTPKFNFDETSTQTYLFSLYPDNIFCYIYPDTDVDGYETSVKEYILCAANIHTNGNIFVVQKPGRHHHIEHWMFSLDIAQTTLRNQGFLTNTGRWVGRKQGLRIAIAAQQLLPNKAQPLTELYSEDLW